MTNLKYPRFTLFTDSDYVDLSDQPTPPHPCWDAFEAWFEERRAIDKSWEVEG